MHLHLQSRIPALQTMDLCARQRCHRPARLRCATVKPKTKLCAAFISSGLDHSGRRAFVTELMGHLPVDSYGAFQRNRGLEDDRGPETKLRVRDELLLSAFSSSSGPPFVDDGSAEQSGCESRIARRTEISGYGTYMF